MPEDAAWADMRLTAGPHKQPRRALPAVWDFRVLGFWVEGSGGRRLGGNAPHGGPPRAAQASPGRRLGMLRVSGVGFRVPEGAAWADMRLTAGPHEQPRRVCRQGLVVGAPVLLCMQGIKTLKPDAQVKNRCRDCAGPCWASLTRTSRQPAACMRFYQASQARLHRGFGGYGLMCLGGK